MTSAELLDKPIAEFVAMSDEQLAAYVAEFIPAARTEYAGRQTTSDALLLPNGKKVTMKQVRKDNETMMNILRMAGVQLPQQ